MRYDDSIISGMDDVALKAHWDDQANYSTMIFKKGAYNWATPFVTGHKYKIHWGATGLDFEKMEITQSTRWRETDRELYIKHNFTDVRAAIDVRMNGGNLTENDTIAAAVADWRTGQNLVQNITDLNNTDPQFLNLVFSGKDIEFVGKRNRMNLVGHRCIGSCTEAVADVPIETNYRRWS